jgi:hypothetical protein
MTAGNAALPGIPNCHESGTTYITTLVSYNKGDKKEGNYQN